MTTAAAPAPAPLPAGRPAKRSLTLRGHRTSVSLEAEFWTAFRDLATARGLGLNALASRIDAGRGDVGLASAIRVAVLGAALSGEIGPR
ncbi:MAG: ribbon-helix-helix domain-containing protein [Rubellimicrobium sp.]|nr:ribbon-helix-helix domain-containing protein [Rubellimicrobium sp.]